MSENGANGEKLAQPAMNHLEKRRRQCDNIGIASPFPETYLENTYISVTIDYFSKWAEAYALPNQKAAVVANVLVKEFFIGFGVQLE